MVYGVVHNFLSLVVRSCKFLTIAHCGLIPNDFHWCHIGKETILGQSLLKYLQVLFSKDIFGFYREKPFRDWARCC